MSNFIIEQTIQYLNKVAGTDYKPDFDSTIKLLENLTKNGYTLEQFKSVIDKKWSDWKGTKYQTFIRPSTLFGNKFEIYLNEPDKRNRKINKLFDSVEKAKRSSWRLD